MSRARVVFRAGHYSIWEHLDAHAFEVSNDHEDGRTIWRGKFEQDNELSRTLTWHRAIGFLQGINYNPHDAKPVDGAVLTDV